MARRKKKSQKQLWIAVIALSAVLLLLIGGIVLSMALRSNKEPEPEATVQMPQGIPAASNEYDTEAFYRQEGFLRYDAAHMIGIDVSAYQGIIDWEQVADSGMEFVIIRAGYRGSSRGLLYEDETFRDNLKEARNAGLKVGVYFFSQARNPQEAVEEGEFVCELLDGVELDLPVFYDWELVEGSDRFSDLSEVPMTECAVAFCEAVEKGNYRAGVYFNQSFGYYHLDMTKLQDYTLWLAEYNEVPTFDYHFHLVQYSDSGTVAGIETPVDLNLWILE